LYVIWSDRPRVILSPASEPGAPLRDPASGAGGPPGQGRPTHLRTVVQSVLETPRRLRSGGPLPPRRPSGDALLGRPDPEPPALPRTTAPPGRTARITSPHALRKVVLGEHLVGVSFPVHRQKVTFLRCRVNDVIERDGQRIPEDRAGFRQGYAVLATIPFGLLGVPFEDMSHGGQYRRRSGAPPCLLETESHGTAVTPPSFL
jgi:hypothetical protein